MDVVFARLKLRYMRSVVSQTKFDHKVPSPDRVAVHLQPACTATAVLIWIKVPHWRGKIMSQWETGS
jgi:hypothetical protein